MRISRSALFLATFAAALASAPPVRAQSTTLVFDPRTPSARPRVSGADSQLLERVARPAARRRWQGVGDECRDGFAVEDVAAGAFTRAGARQRAFLYSYCRMGRVGGRGGVAVVENGRVVAHVMMEGTQYGIRAARDVNRNGRDEMVLVDGSTGQGITVESASLMELAPGNGALAKLATFAVSEDNCATRGAGARPEANVIHARPGRTPRFYQQAYRGTCADRPRWTPAGALKPVTPGR